MVVSDTNYSDVGESQSDILKAKVDAIAGRVQAMAIRDEGKRKTIEDRWYEDLRQIHGRYDEETEAKLIASKKSRLYIKATRPKCITWAAKLNDLLFPTDDKNWGMGATPVPELGYAIDQEPKDDEVEKQQQEFERREELGESKDVMFGQQEDLSQRFEAAEAARAYTSDAKFKARAMERVCEDQLIEARYNVACRMSIKDSVEIGTGIVKGPFDDGVSSKRWVKLKGEDGETTGWEKRDQVGDMPRPTYKHIDYWSFFPDPNARTIEEAEYTFERHVVTAKTLRKWARSEDFDKDAIRELVRAESNDTVPNYITQVRAITHKEAANIENKYVVWEYRGPLEVHEMQSLFKVDGNEEALEVFEELDPLEEISVVLYVSNNSVLKFGISALDSGEGVYSVNNLVKDPSSIWGWGIPFLMRDSQTAMNAAWRMMLDNGGLSVGPQIVINKKAVEPQNGDYALTPRKIWYVKEDLPKGTQPAFDTFHIDSRQTELANIIAMAKEFSDEETNLPAIASGEEAAGSKNTFGGMALLANAANVVFREAVRNFDDNITVPNLRRLFDWNMQFNPNDDIKGDITIDARGSGVLLVREIQSQNMLLILERFSDHPVLGPLTKVADAYRKTISGMMIAADDIVYTDEEIEKQTKDAQERAEKEGTPPTPEEIKLQIAQLEADAKVYVAEMENDTAMIRLAETREMKLEELQLMLGDKRAERESRERTFAGEAAVKDRLADKAIAANKPDNMPTGTKYEA